MPTPPPIPEGRPITCPYCGHLRQTRATRNTRLRCPSCRRSYLVPAGAPTATTPAPFGLPDPLEAAASAGPGGGGEVTVVEVEPLEFPPALVAPPGVEAEQATVTGDPAGRPEPPAPEPPATTPGPAPASRLAVRRRLRGHADRRRR